MRARLLALIALCSFPAILPAQAPPPQAAAAPQPMPVRRVVLYKTGVGYFEHLGAVRNNQDITIRFTSAQLNDVLKSLTAIDLGKGQVTGISYTSVAPLERRLGALRLPVDQQSTMVQLLASLRGARVEVSSGTTSVSGRLLSVEQRTETREDRNVSVQVFSILTDAGEMRSFELTPSVRVRLAERDMRQELGRYLDVLGSAREQDVRNMVISTSGTGERRLFVSYISEVPIWKTSYRLVFPDGGKPLLQGWAVVDNTIGEDWRDVELSLVAGAPQSFIQNLSQPYYGRRPVVPLPRSILLDPQTHDATLRQGQNTRPGALTESVTVHGMPSQDVVEQRRGVLGGMVGGLPSAPPPPPAPAAIAEEAYAELRRSQAAAEGGNLGELFEYRIKEPITLEKNKSALVPIVSAEITAERVSLWNQAQGSGRPLRAMWLTNTTGLTLDGGSMAIVDGNAFAGEGLIQPLKPGEKRLVSYAADLGLLVNARRQNVPRRIFRLRVRDGILIQDTEERATTTYDVRSEAATPTTLIVEHYLRNGWKLAAGQKPAESTAGAERFRVTIDPGKETSLAVTEVSAGTSHVRVGEVGPELIAQLSASGVSADALQRALQPVIDKRTEIASLDRQVGELETERQRILENQQRLRENMKALRGSAEEKQLLQRYTRQLDEQENRLAVLQQEHDRLSKARDAANAELARLIAAVTFEWEGN